MWLIGGCIFHRLVLISETWPSYPNMAVCMQNLHVLYTHTCVCVSVCVFVQKCNPHLSTVAAVALSRVPPAV